MLLKIIGIAVIAVCGGLIGRSSPWEVSDPLFWFVIAPVAFLWGIVGTLLWDWAVDQIMGAG